MDGLQHFQDPGSLEWFVFQHFQDPEFSEWLDFVSIFQVSQVKTSYFEAQHEMLLSDTRMKRTQRDSNARFRGDICS